jgi:hypothetical protein
LLDPPHAILHPVSAPANTVDATAGQPLVPDDTFQSKPPEWPH